MGLTSALLSWTVVIALSYAAYYYYGRSGSPRIKTLRKAPQPGQPQPRLNKRKEDARAGRTVDTTSSDAASENEPAKKRKVTRKPVEQPRQNAPSAPVHGTAAEEAEADDEDHTDWARQLAGVQKGVTLTSDTSAAPRHRTVKQSATTGTTEPSTSSSTTGADTGADADDDLSPALSPPLTADKPNGGPSGKDISDMLEAPSKGPSVLRIGEPAAPDHPKRQQQQREVESQESKKQRQNRRKVEESKAIREHEERERKILEEKQRRTAREARGEPAKNGILPGKPPATSAWAASPQAYSDEMAKETAAGVPTVNAQLLDTFDNSGETSMRSTSAPTNGTSARPSEIDWEAQLPSEEDQLRMINSMVEDAGWNTVQNPRKGKKKTGVSDGTDTENSITGSERQGTPANGIHNTQSTNTAGTQGTKSVSVSESAAQYQTGGHPADSDWSVV